MTKAENRAAAKAYDQKRMRELEEKAEAERVKAESPSSTGSVATSFSGIQARHRGGDREKLMNAIDDYVEEMTGGPSCTLGHRASVEAAKLRRPYFIDPKLMKYRVFPTSSVTSRDHCWPGRNLPSTSCITSPASLVAVCHAASYYPC